MVNAAAIRNGMPVIASDGEPVGAVDGVEGDRLKLTRKDSLDNRHHFIPLAWVASADERVHLNRSRADVMAGWGSETAGTAAGATASHGTSRVTPAAAPARKTNWLPWLLLGLGLLALLWWLSRRGDDPQPVTTTTEQTTTVAPTAGGPDVSGETAPAGVAAAGAAGTGNALADLQAYLASPEPAGRRFSFDNIHFATNSAELPADAQPVIAGIVQAVQAAPNARIRVEGYADARGAAQANAQLGAQRADTVARALIAAGVAPGRLESASGGELNPIDTNATAQGQADNRRTDIVIVSK